MFKRRFLRFRIVNNTTDHGFRIGEMVTVEARNGWTVAKAYSQEGKSWWVNRNDVHLVGELHEDES